jgi:hypothetical protein
MKAQVTEKVITSIWQRWLVPKLFSDIGEQIQVVHPGRISNVSGCDFRDAIFTINGKTITGDIEVHVKSSQWQGHGHHLDPKYNNIALHIVWWHDSQAPTLLQNGKVIPTICLSSFINSPLDELDSQANSYGQPPTSCQEVSHHSNTDGLSKLLTTAGIERFAAKISSFRKALSEDDAGQVLYRGIARALGYTQNAAPCEELANRLPLNILEEVGRGDNCTRQALILGTAGLLPSQRHRLQNRPAKDREANKLERTWQAIGITGTMKEVDWCFFRVRPDNFPIRRLIALIYLLARYNKSGLLQGILRLVREAPPGAEHRWLENGLIIAGQGYWKNHLDFSIVTKRNSSLVGQEKASVIAIDAILPFVHAWGEVSDELWLQKRAAEIYRRYPKTGDNELTRYMMQQLRLKLDVRLSACQQQGLIHIFKTYCRRRNCAECPVATNRC